MRAGNKGRYWCQKKGVRLDWAKVRAVCLLKGCPHLWIRVLPGRKK